MHTTNQTQTTSKSQERDAAIQIVAKGEEVRFNKHHVAKGDVKARVWYSLDNRIDGRRCVTLYAKDYGRGLGEIFCDEYINDTDSQTDYFDTGRVVLFEDHPPVFRGAGEGGSESAVKTASFNS